MKWAKNLLIGEGVGKNAAKYKFKIRFDKGAFGVYVLVQSTCENYQLEIIQSTELHKKSIPTKDMVIVGIAQGEDEAIDMVNSLVQRALDETGEADIRSIVREQIVG